MCGWRVPENITTRSTSSSLSSDVLYESRFKRCNPDYDPAKPCVYVGMTGLNPDERFDKHKAGIRANRYVRDYGLRLIPELYECYNPMPYDAAKDMEVELAIAAAKRGLRGVAGVALRPPRRGGGLRGGVKERTRTRASRERLGAR